MNKKVYFAGSIRGGRADAALYSRMIDFIKETDTVLTEHVAHPELNVLERGRDFDAAIYAQDVAWLRESDLVVAECSNPSLGVGYELAYAEALGKPVHIFYDAGRTQLSAMLTGDVYFQIHAYRREEEIWPALREILS